MVNRAVQLKARSAEVDSGTEPFDQVWCVIDGDFGSKIVNARAKAEANEIKLAISIMCFEYWVLLHFKEYDSATNTCNELVNVLKQKHLPNYEKGKCDFKEIVVYVDKASKRAEKLRKPGIKRGDPPEKQNPCSEVYLLIKAILDVSP